MTPERSRGCWVTLRDPVVAARVAAGGFDWVCVDRQHAAIDERALAEIARATASSTAALHVRVRSNSVAEIGFAVDVGARVVIVPMVDSAAGARQAALSAFYPPEGQRSWGQLSATWSDVVPAAEANARTGVWAMIETPAGLENCREIAATPGISGLFVGPFDLSLGLGMSRDELLAMRGSGSPLARIVDAARSAGIAAGAYAGDLSLADALSGAGFTDLAITTDIGLLDDAIARAVATD